MKYLVAAEDTTLEDNVSSHFGRAPYFIIYDTDKDSFETITNGENVDPHLEHIITITRTTEFPRILNAASGFQ